LSEVLTKNNAPKTGAFPISHKSRVGAESAKPIGRLASNPVATLRADNGVQIILIAPLCVALRILRTTRDLRINRHGTEKPLGGPVDRTWQHAER